MNHAHAVMTDLGLRSCSHYRALQLMAAHSLPSWWLFKFHQADAILHGTAFSADTYNGCHLHLFLNGTCYQVLLGSFLVISHTTESKCRNWRESQGVTLGVTYSYMYSMYGTQTYQSSEPCFPLAAHRQVEFEIVDLPFSSTQQEVFLSSSMIGDCRRAVRYVIDAKKLQCDSDMKMIAKLHSPKEISDQS